MKLNKKFLKKFTASDSDIVVHCKTQEEATIFCKWMNSMGLKWSTGSSYIGNTDWYNHGEETCYRGNGRFAKETYYTSNQYNVVRLKHLISNKSVFIRRFKANKIAVNCRTREEARSFCDWMHSIGMTWRSGDGYRSDTKWATHREKTLYYGDGMFGTALKGGYKDNDYELVYYSAIAGEIDGTVTTVKQVEPVATISDSKVGDKVWTVQWGWGVITEIREDNTYKLLVEITNNSGGILEKSFTHDGKYYPADVYPTLLLEKP